MSASAPSVLRARIDARALTENVRALRAQVGQRRLMCVVKADAYGHGLAQTVPALLRGGVRDLGAATLAEALEVHTLLLDLQSAVGTPGARQQPEAGDEEPSETLPAAGDVRILFWLHDSRTDLAPALRADIEVGCSTAEGVRRAAEAAGRTGVPARVHLKVDTGLGRGGFTAAQFAALLSELRGWTSTEAEHLRITGLMTHLANADVPGDPATAEQVAEFRARQRELAAFLDSVGGALGDPEALETHLANSPGALGGEEIGGTMVRVGLSTYGLSPFEDHTAADLGLRPAMSLVSRVLTVKEVPAGHGASYGLTYRAPADTRFALVAGGYADGLPRGASGRAQVTIRGRRFPVVGRIAMDQMVVDVGDAPVETGDAVVILGDGRTGPSAEEWGEWAGTINYEIVARVGPRVDREVASGPLPESADANAAIDASRLRIRPDEDLSAGESADGNGSADASRLRADPVRLRIADREGMAAFASGLAAVLRAGDVVVLTGNLGAGKTTLTQFLGRALDVRGRVSSPTFTIAREHPARGAGPGLVHVDAYRLTRAEEFEDLGLDAALDESVTVVEWGRGMAESLGDHLDIEILRTGALGAADAEVTGVGAPEADDGLEAELTGAERSGDVPAGEALGTAGGTAEPTGDALDDALGGSEGEDRGPAEDGAEDEERIVVIHPVGPAWEERGESLRGLVRAFPSASAHGAPAQPVPTVHAPTHQEGDRP